MTRGHRGSDCAVSTGRLPNAARVLLAIASLVVAATASAVARDERGDREIGLPLFRSFLPKEYSAHPQNWCVIQDGRGLIYVGNGDGILEFDGAHWRLIRVANGTEVRSLAIDRTGRIIVGANREIGALEPDALGRMQYVSWMNRLPETERDFPDVSQILVTEDGIIFSTPKKIFRLGGQFRSWNTPRTYSRTHLVGNRLFVRELGRGLLELSGDEWRLMPGGERFADEFVSRVLPGDTPSTLLIGCRQQGLFLFDGASFHPIPTDVDAIIKRDYLRSVARLPDGTLALATIQSGLYFLTEQMGLRTHLSSDEGLPDDNIVATFQDREGGLWLAFNKGLARVESCHPITVFTKSNGVNSTVISLYRHQGTLYAGLNAGLAHLVANKAGNARFIAVPEVTSQTWDFLDTGSALLVGNYAGVYELKDGRTKLVRPSIAALSLWRSRGDPSRVFIGLRNGIAAMRWDGRQWQDEGRMIGIDDQVRTLREAADGRLWGSAYTNGIFRLTFDGPGFDSTPTIERFGEAHGLPDARSNEVALIDDVPAFATSQGIFRFDEATGRFAADPRFAGLFPDGPRAVECLTKDSRGWIWTISTDERRRLIEGGAAVPDQAGHYRWEPRPLRALLGSDLDIAHCDADGVMWFGGSDGLFRYDPRIPKDYEQPFSALVRKVTGPKDKLYFGGTGPVAAPALDYADNTLRFEFAGPSFPGLEANRFQTLLEGQDEDWSPWSTETYRVYSNLREGAYTFRVRARNLYGTISTEASFALTIRPPWYRTWWAYAAYVLMAGAAGEGIFLWRIRALRRKTRQLEADIAERKRLQAALQASEERYRLLFEQNPLAMWIHDAKTLRFLAVNESAIERYGYTREEFLGMGYERILHGEDLPKLHKHVVEEQADKSAYGEFRHQRKNGTIIHVEVFSKPLTIGTTFARLVLVNDVTEKRLIQEQFLHAQRLESIGMLAAGIAHDLNNVLAPIMMAAPLLRKNVSGPRELRMVDTIEQSAARGAGLVKQILGFAHSTSGDFQPTQVKHLLRDIINVIEETFPKAIRLEHSVPSDLWLVDGNASQIHQVLLNLCVNARDAMPRGGTLRLVAANRRLSAEEAAAIPEGQPGAWILLEVSDTGTGIPPEVLERIWTPFFTTKEIGKGTGLGLSTVRSIVIGHHGFIQLDTQLGRGSTFRVYLPAAASEASPALDASQTAVAAGRNEMILVVDDTESIRNTIMAVVEEAGYRAVGCVDGVDALERFAAEREKISLVITDVDMPRLDGVGLAQALLKLRPDIRILALSGKSDDDNSGAVRIESLAHGFLHKPFKPDELLHAIVHVLRSPGGPLNRSETGKSSAS